MLETIEFAGQTAVITGGTSGIGKSTAFLLARRGGRVVICGRDAARLEGALQEAHRENLALSGLVANARSQQDMKALMDHACDVAGGVDILVNNAGGSTALVNFAEITDEAWHTVMDANLTAILLSSRLAIPFMKKRGGGAIVNVASVHAHATTVDRCAYAAAKAGVVGLTKAMASDLGPDNIRVNSVSPGPIMTDRLRATWGAWIPDHPAEATLKAVGRNHPLGHIGEPEDVAEAIAFLASRRAKFVTGVDIRVDGGLAIRLPMMPEHLSYDKLPPK
jgi:NAD(P)-dependent dehydrogenase (short-subunit alcohol dehydrogenase family)